MVRQSRSSPALMAAMKLEMALGSNQARYTPQAFDLSKAATDRLDNARTLREQNLVSLMANSSVKQQRVRTATALTATERSQSRRVPKRRGPMRTKGGEVGLTGDLV